MDYQILSTDNGGVLNVDSTQGPAVLTLPSPTAGFKVTIKDIGGSSVTNAINVFRFAGESIDNIPADFQINENFAGVTLVSDGTNWFRCDSFHRQIQNTGRALWGGGAIGGSTTYATIDYVTISTTGNATGFGTLTQSRQSMAAMASSTRGVWAGGIDGGETTQYSNIDYVTIATTGNAVSFGTLQSNAGKGYSGGCSNSTRGIISGGSSLGGSAYNNIDYITIQMLSNTTTFGTLATARYRATNFASPTRAILGAGTSGSIIGNYEYITIATTGNGTTFGNMNQPRSECGGMTNGIRGLVGGGIDSGASTYTLIEYITIATTGNGANFGNLSSARRSCNNIGTSSFTTGIWGGGAGPSATIETSIFSTLANTTAFGNLTVARQDPGALSSCHGGLNG